jgi:hypothetical protein
MTHIAWFTTIPSGPVSILLGSAPGWGEYDPGGDRQKAEILLRWRQKAMTNLNFEPPMIDQLVESDPKGNGGDTGFGRCAETFLWIVAKR